MNSSNHKNLGNILRNLLTNGFSSDLQTIKDDVILGWKAMALACDHSIGKQPLSWIDFEVNYAFMCLREDAWHNGGKDKPTDWKMTASYREASDLKTSYACADFYKIHDWLQFSASDTD